MQSDAVDSRKQGILAYEIVSIAAFAAVLFFGLLRGQSQWWEVINTGLSGGIGSAARALYELLSHKTRQRIWYILNPVVGLLSGLSLYGLVTLKSIPEENYMAWRVLGYFGMLVFCFVVDVTGILYESISRLVPDKSGDVRPKAPDIPQAMQDQVISEPQQVDDKAFRCILGVLAYNLVFLGPLIIVLYLDPVWSDQRLAIMFDSLLLGAAGGVALSFYGLYRHGWELKDFDGRYVMWYVANPIIGALLGGLVYQLLGMGWLLNLFGERWELVIKVASFFAGFKQQFLLSVIARIVGAFGPKQDKQDGSK